MFGPIFLLEWRYAARRCRHFRFRALYTALVVGEFLLFLWAWLSRGFDPFGRPTTPWRLTGQVVADYLPLFALQHVGLLLLITPALAAGSVSDEKNRGTFTLLFTTRLTTGEIILSKWLGQCVQMLVLALPARPFMTFLWAMLGVSATTVLAWGVESAVLVMLLAAFSILASVWARRTVTAVIAAYILLNAVLVGGWWAGAGNLLDESLLIVPLSDPVHSSVGAGWVRWMLMLAALAAIGVLLAAWRLRPACATVRMASPRPRWWWRWVGRPPVHQAPVRWKERYIGELGLFAFARKLPRWGLIGMALASGLLAALVVQGSDELFLAHGVGMVLVAGLLVAVRSSGAICREREAHTWDGLLMTPLEPHDLVRGKLWGIIDSIKPYLIAYGAGVMVWAASTLRPLPIVVTAYCWLATWVFLYFQAANGVYQSARAAGSWQALLYTVGSGMMALVPRAMFALVAALVIFVVGLVLSMGAGSRGAAGDPMFVAAVAIGFITAICVQLLAQAELLLQQAEQHIAERDRIAQGRGSWGHGVLCHEWTTAIARPRMKGAP